MESIEDVMPTEDCGEIGSVKSFGWQTINISCQGEMQMRGSLYTTTQYLNMKGMLQLENMVADFVKETGGHVMYRVTPVFDRNNLVADGLLIESKLVEVGGQGILFNVFCYNIQPRSIIDYATGNSEEDGSIVVEEEITHVEEAPLDTFADSGAYAVNSVSSKIHIMGKRPATENGSNVASVYFWNL